MSSTPAKPAPVVSGRFVRSRVVRDSRRKNAERLQRSQKRLPSVNRSKFSKFVPFAMEDNPDLSAAEKPRFFNFQEKRKKFEKFRKKRLSNINECSNNDEDCEELIQLESSPHGIEPRVGVNYVPLYYPTIYVFLCTNMQIFRVTMSKCDP